MALYFADTEITGINDLFPLSSKDITGLYFADTELFTVWGEYDGTLPAQYSANGDYLVDYRIYGAAGGVGDRTVNLFDTEIEQGNLYAGAIQPPTSENYYKRCRTKDYVKVTAGNTITVKSQYDLWVYCYSGTTYISQYGSTNWNKKYTFTVPSGINNIKIMFAKDDKTANLYISDFANDVMLVNGSTAPAEYVPFGYEVDMSVSDGSTATTTPIYIGDPLEEDEYVSFKEQKIYCRTENLWNGVYEQGGLDFMTGSTFESANYVHTGRMRCGGMTDIAITYFAELEQGVIAFYDINGDYILEGSEMMISGGDPTFEYHISVPSGAAYVAISFSAADSSQPISPATAAQVTVVEGSTAPSTYIPYLQPEDPPVSLPALPTVDGTNIVDYEGQSAAVPSRFYAKYRKEGFN